MSNKKLTKSKDKIIMGVLGGFAECYGWDPTLTRIVFVLLVLLTGIFPFVVVYIIAGIIMKPSQDVETEVVEIKNN